MCKCLWRMCKCFEFAAKQAINDAKTPKFAIFFLSLQPKNFRQMKRAIKLRILFWTMTAAMLPLMTSCFKEEPFNAECDIETAWVEVENVDDVFYHESDAKVNVIYASSTVIFNVKPEADVTAMSPMFNLTEGATISPANGSTHDFSGAGVQYTVTSQDGKWKRTYLVRFVRPYEVVTDEIVMDFEKFDFVDAKLKRYYQWFSEDGTEGDYWANGNAGYKMSYRAALPEEYPTNPLEHGYEGYGVKLTTCNTFKWGEDYQKPIAAGNLYLGTFTTKYALTNTLLCTNFGIRWNKRPYKLTGYYKFKAGEQFIDKDKNVLNRKDVGSIYSVLYRNRDKDGNAIVLHGDDVLTNENIVALAKVKDLHETNEWTYFEVEYEYSEEIDFDLLASFGYNFTVVFSSSEDGASFEGAIGSTLCVDKVRVICKTKENKEEEEEAE